MTHRSYWLLALTIFATMISGCGAPAVSQPTDELLRDPSAVRTRPADPIILSTDASRIHPEAFEHYVNGNLYESLGNAYRASESYRQALRYYPDSYEIRFSLAENLFRMQRLDDALNVLGPIYPTDYFVWELRALINRAAGEEDSAHVAYLEAIKFDTMQTEPYSYLVTWFGRANDIDSTFWGFQNLARLAPDNYAIWFEMARLQLRRGEIDAAKESFRTSAELRSDAVNVMALVGLGEIHEAQGALDSALLVFQQGLRSDPGNIAIHRNLAGLYVKLDSLEEAAAHARIESELAPLDRQSSRRLGFLYFFLDSLDAADSVFTALVASGEHNWVNSSYLGRIAVRQDRPEDAIEHFRQVVQVADTVWENWFELAGAYQLLGDSVRQVQTYRDGLERVGDEVGRQRLMFALGASLEQTGRYEESVATFEEFLTYWPDSDGALNYLGYMLADRGERLPYARTLIEGALENAPDNAAYLDSYGWVLYRLGEFQEALEVLKRAVALDTDPVMFDHLGDTYKALGKMEEARHWWQKALEADPDLAGVKAKLSE